MKALLITIPHTGTRFMHKMLNDNGVVCLSYKDREADVFFEHLTERYVQTIKKLKAMGVRIISPMRERHKIEASWEADTTDWGNSLDECFEWFEDIKDIVVNIDNLETRDAELAKVSELLGVTIETDWTPVGARNGNNH